MSRRLWLVLFLVVIAVPIAALTTLPQDEPSPTPTIDITGVDPSDLPQARVTTNVFDQFGQHIPGLTVDDFILSGELADQAQIVAVENITDDALPISVILVIDTSTSMSGRPIAEAKDAARLFVESLSADDSVAILSFSTTVQLVQDFSTDKTVLTSAIDGLQAVGQTALYDASAEALRTIENAPSERTTIVFLSDGAEYGGIATTGQVAPASVTLREEALRLAQVGGVPFYTIGLGYGTDRTYLEEAADLTNARFYESPTPEELSTVYAEIADLLRTQYIITLQADLPLDGTEYTLALQAQTPNGTTNTDEAILRAPIPVPIIVPLIQLDAAWGEPTTVTFDILADDLPLDVTLDAAIPEAYTASLDGTTYSVTVDVFQLPPGSRSFTINATDADGDTATEDYGFGIAQLATDFAITGLNDQTVFEGPFTADDVITVGVDIAYTQTPVSEVVYSVNGETVATAVDATNAVDIPLEFESGTQTLAVTVNTENGQPETREIEFIVRNYPAPVIIPREAPPETISEPITLLFDVASDDAPVTELPFELSVEPLAEDAIQTAFAEDGAYAVTVNPRSLPAGPLTLTLNLADADGDTSTQAVDLNIDAFPPEFEVTGITPGQTFSDTFAPDDTLSVEVVFDYLQAPVVDVVYTLNGEVVATQAVAPFSFNFNWLENFSGGGEQTLSVSVYTQNDRQATLDIPFTVMVLPTATPSPLPTPTVNLPATVQAQAPAIDSAVNNIFEIVDNRATQTQQAAIEATSSALETTQAINQANAQASATAFISSATEAAAATQDAQQQGSANATGTREAIQTNQAANLANAQASSTAFIATREAEDTVEANATESEQIAATEVRQTVVAQATVAMAETMDALQTVDAEATGSAQATTDAQSDATAVAQGNVQATTDALATVEAQSTADAQSTEGAEATNAAELTLAAQQTATAIAQSTQVEQATRDAEATVGAGETAQAVLTLEAEATAEATAQAIAQATTDAQATVDAQATLDAEETEEPTVTATPQPTLTPIGELTEIETGADDDGGDDLTPLLFIGGGILLLLILLWLLFGRRRKDDERTRR